MTASQFHAALLCGITACAVRAATVQIDVVDHAGQRMPARIHLKDAGGKTQLAPPLPAWRDHFVCTGRVDIELSAGKYTYEVERGPEFTSVSSSFSAADATNIKVTLTRLTDLAREG